MPSLWEDTITRMTRLELERALARGIRDRIIDCACEPIDDAVLEQRMTETLRRWADKS